MTTSNRIIRISTTYAPLCALHALAAASPASAATFELTGTITSCTPTCNSFVFLGPDTGDPTDGASVLNGFISLDDAAIADDSWTGGDVTGLSFEVLDPARPLFTSDPPDPITDNPYTIDQSVEGGGVVVANGQPITNPRGTFPACVPPETTGCVVTSAGTTDGTRIDGGVMDLWLTQGVLANDGTVVHIDFSTGTFSVNIFENLIFVAGGILGEPRPVIAVPATLIFEDTQVGDVSFMDLNPSNAGSLALVIEAVAAPDVPFVLEADGCSGQTLAPGQGCPLTVSFAPTVEGLAEGSLRISSNDPNQPVVETALSGVSTPGVGMVARQIAGTIGTCWNITTEQRLSISLNGARAVPCEGAGLESSPSDILRLRIRGTAQSTAAPSGHVRGMDLVSFFCKNETTGGGVGNSDPVGLVHEWDCDSLPFSVGDVLKITVRGKAE